jgi:hypothetical protein
MDREIKMDRKRKEFLRKLEEEDTDNYFLFYKFYFFPSRVLGGSDDETIDKYYEYGDIKRLILNYKFYEFLEICMEDKTFKEKLDFNLLRKIRFILFDCKDFKNEYISDLEDDYLQKFCQGEVTSGPVYSKKYKSIELWLISEHYKKVGWIYKLNISDEKDKIDINLLKDLIRTNESEQNVYYATYIEPINIRKRLLDSLKKGNYNFFVDMELRDRRKFRSLICDNEFLSVAKEYLFPIELPPEVIDNIIYIIDIGIDFKKMNSDKYTNFNYYYELLGKERVKEFSYQEAIEVKNLFEKKKKNYDDNKSLKIKQKRREGFKIIK